MKLDLHYHSVVQTIQAQTDPVKRKALKAVYFATLYGGPSTVIQPELGKLLNEANDTLSKTR